jgi:hypothetical protein
MNVTLFPPPRRKEPNIKKINFQSYVLLPSAGQFIWSQMGQFLLALKKKYGNSDSDVRLQRFSLMSHSQIAGRWPDIREKEERRSLRDGI